MFEQFSGDYSEADIARAVEVAAGLEAEDSLDAVSKVLWAKAEELRATEPKIAELLAADVWACQLQLTGAERQAGGALPLEPLMTYTDGTAYPPHVPEWPDFLQPYFVARAARTTLQQTHARYNDFVWIKWHVFTNASVAHEAYLTIGTGNGFAAGGKAAETMNELGRAICLSQDLKLKRPETAAIIADELDQALSDDAWLGVRLITPKTASLLAIDPTRAAALVTALTTAAEKLDAANPEWARGVYAAAVLVAEGLRDEAGAAVIRSAIATSWESEAASTTDPMKRLYILQGALAAYQAIPGSGAAVRRLKTQLAEASASTAQNLPMHKFEVKIPNAEIDATLDKLRGLLAGEQFGLLRLPLYLGLLPDWDKLQASFDAQRKQFPLQYLFSRVSVDRDGRMQAQPADEAEREQVLLLEHFAQTQQYGAMIAFRYVAGLRESGEWSADKLIAMIEELDPEMTAACRSGIEAFEAEDYWTALHVLVPQIERGLRNVAVEIDGNVHRLIGTVEVRVATLDKILEDPEFEKRFGPNVVKSLRGHLTDPRGLNLRNLTAHGLIDPSQVQAPAAYLALMCVLIAIWLRAAVEAENQAAAS